MGAHTRRTTGVVGKGVGKGIKGRLGTNIMEFLGCLHMGFLFCYLVFLVRFA